MHLLWATDGFGSGHEMGKDRPSANHSLLLIIHSYVIPVSYPFIPVQFHWLPWSRLKLPGQPGLNLQRIGPYTSLTKPQIQTHPTVFNQ